MRTALCWALVACALVSGCRRRAAPPQLTAPEDEVWLKPAVFESGEATLAEARTQVLPQSIVVGGRIAFHDEHVSHIFSPVTGRVTRVLAQFGETVKPGTPLVAIVSPDVGSAFSDEVKARADLVAAQHDLDRQKKLFEDKAASSRDYETAEDNYRKAKAEEERALQRLRLLRSGQVDKVTQEYTLPSPIAGRVVARAVNAGVEIQGQFSGGTAVDLFTIGDIDSVWVFADVPETNVSELHLGAPVTVRVLAYPEHVFLGTIDWISPTLDPVLRTTRVRASVANPDGLLKPEMYATVVIERPAVEKLAIPREAIVRIDEHPFVYVAAGTRPDGRHVFKRRQVQVPDNSGRADKGTSGQLPVDPTNSGPVPVLAGLAEGEKVLVEVARSNQPSGVTVSLGNEEAISKVGTALVEQVDLPHAVTVGGRLTFDDVLVTHVYSPVNGRVTKLLAAPGQHVKKGSPLATILSPDVGSAFSDELKARADLVAAEHEVQRQREMYVEKASSQRDLEGAEDNYGKAKAEYDRAAQKSQLLREGAVDAVSQEYLLRSPIEGDVVGRAANPGLEVQGQYSGAGNVVELFTIGKIDRLWLLSDVYEADLPYMKEGAQLNIQVSAYPGRMFKGTVDWVSDTLDPVMRTAKVRCVLDNAEGLLRPEMYGVVQIAAPVRQALAVPRDAVLRDGDETVVFVQQKPAADGKVSFARRKVVTNEAFPGELVPVVSGLSAGERVATTGSIFLLGM